MRIEYTFTQKYHSWGEYSPPCWFDYRSETFDILEKLDTLESDVYSDRDFTIATGMFDDIGISVN